MNAPDIIRVAIVDDDPLFMDRVAVTLAHEAKMSVIQANSSRDLMGKMSNDEVDCVVIDYDLGRESGLAVADRINATLSNPPPVVMLTGEGNERTAVKAFRNGFSDYVTKRNLLTSELADVIRRAVRKHKEQQAASLEVELLKSQLHLDSVTGLHSRSYFEVEINDLAQDEGVSRFWIQVLRPRGMGEIVAKLGRAVSNRVQRELARRVKAAIGADSDCVHLSDGVFARLVTEEGEIAPPALAQLHAALNFDMEVEGVRLAIAIHTGLAEFPANGRDATSLLGHALAALPQDDAADDGSEDAVGGAGAGVVLEERRNETRRRVLRRGRILLGKLGGAIDCSVRDLSDHGARLRIEGYFAAPRAFELEIVGAGAAIHQAQLRWQAGHEIGVTFRRDGE